MPLSLIDVFLVAVIVVLLVIVGTVVLKNRGMWSETAEAISADRWIWCGIFFVILALGVAGLFAAEGDTVSPIAFWTGFAGMGVVKVVSQVVDHYRELKENGPPSTLKTLCNDLPETLA